MNKVLFFVFISAFAFVSKGRAGEIDELLKGLPGNKRKIAETLVKIVPAGTRQGIDDYLAVIGVEANGGHNVGFKTYNENYLKNNACFHELAAEFYAGIMVEDVHQRLKERPLEVSTLFEKAKLNQTVADMKMQPGWFWERALTAAQGDRLLAMQLIGVCGHDDMNQLDNGMTLSPESRQRLAANFSDKDLRKLINAAWKTLPAEKRKSLGNEAVEELYLELHRRLNFLTDDWVDCPFSASIMYYPQALGKEVDVPQNIKDRVARVQAPTKGASVLPAKPYHIMGAAFSSCHLIRREVPGIVSKKIVRGAFNAYRSNRVCGKLMAGNSIFKNRSAKEIVADIKKIRNNPSQCFEEVRDPETNEPNGDYRRFVGDELPDFCRSSTLFDYSILTDPDITEEIFLSKVTRVLAELDSAEMFRRSPYFKSAGGCEGPQLTEAVRDFLEANGAEKHGGKSCKGLSEERCVAARKVMDTYLVDFEWTDAQHMAGYEFAKKNCPPYDAAKTPEVMACKILGRKPSSGSSPGGAGGASKTSPQAQPKSGTR